MVPIISPAKLLPVEIFRAKPCFFFFFYLLFVSVKIFRPFEGRRYYNKGSGDEMKSICRGAAKKQHVGRAASLAGTGRCATFLIRNVHNIKPCACGPLKVKPTQQGRSVHPRICIMASFVLISAYLNGIQC